jgi:hypothetical protein
MLHKTRDKVHFTSEGFVLHFMCVYESSMDEKRCCDADTWHFAWVGSRPKMHTSSLCWKPDLYTYLKLSGPTIYVGRWCWHSVLVWSLGYERTALLSCRHINILGFLEALRNSNAACTSSHLSSIEKWHVHYTVEWIADWRVTFRLRVVLMSF